MKRNALLPAISAIAVAAPGGFGSGSGKIAWQLSGPWQEGVPDKAVPARTPFLRGGPTPSSGNGASGCPHDGDDGTISPK